MELDSTLEGKIVGRMDPIGAQRRYHSCSEGVFVLVVAEPRVLVAAAAAALIVVAVAVVASVVASWGCPDYPK